MLLLRPSSGRSRIQQFRLLSGYNPTTIMYPRYCNHPTSRRNLSSSVLSRHNSIIVNVSPLYHHRRRLKPFESLHSCGNFHRFLLDCGKARKLYHTSVDLQEEEKIRLTTLRLYRILQRTCTEFVKLEPGNDNVLLQPTLQAPDWGRHAVFTQSVPTQVEELFRLFYVWNDDSSTDNRNKKSGNSSNSDNGNISRVQSTTEPTASFSSHPQMSTYNPSKIDQWFHELVVNNRDNDENVDDENADQSDSSSSTSLPPMVTMTCWTSQRQIREAIRIAFRKLQYNNNHAKSGTKTTNLTSKDLHEFAIKAVHMLQEQQMLWSHTSVATTNRVVRIVATSRCIGTTAPAPTTMPPSITSPQILADTSPKYRFAYRIRVENISDDQTIQLLGRYWHISEEPVHVPGMDDDEMEIPPPIIVNSPKTGAVGQLPVLHPGQVFEYMSGTDLASPKGSMKGHLYMASVPSTAKSAKSGDNIDVMLEEAKQKAQSTTETDSDDTDSYETKFFEATVAPFPLEA